MVERLPYAICRPANHVQQSLDRDHHDETQAEIDARQTGDGGLTATCRQAGVRQAGMKAGMKRQRWPSRSELPIFKLNKAFRSAGLS